MRAIYLVELHFFVILFVVFGQVFIVGFDLGRLGLLYCNVSTLLCPCEAEVDVEDEIVVQYKSIAAISCLKANYVTIRVALCSQLFFYSV